MRRRRAGAVGSRPPRTWPARIGLGSGVLGVAVGVLGLVARLVAVPWWPAVVLAALQPWATVVAVVSGVVLLALRAWPGAVVAALVLTTTVVQQAPLFAGGSSRDGSDLTVLQANLQVGAADAATLVALVRDHHVDVLTVDELTPDALQRLSAAGLDRLLPHRFVRPHPGGGGTGIWGRAELGNPVGHGGFTFEVLSADVVLRGTTVHVIAPHLLPPWPYPVSTWAREVAALDAIMQDSAGRTGPVVVSGDLNASLDVPQLRGLLRSPWRDAAEQAGAGWAPTYPTDKPGPPFLTLDHVLVQDVTTRSAVLVDLPGSDHRGLLVSLTLPA